MSDDLERQFLASLTPAEQAIERFIDRLYLAETDKVGDSDLEALSHSFFRLGAGAVIGELAKFGDPQFGEVMAALGIAVIDQ